MHLEGSVKVLQSYIAQTDHSLVVQTAAGTVVDEVGIVVVSGNAETIEVRRFVQLIKMQIFREKIFIWAFVLTLLSLRWEMFILS